MELFSYSFLVLYKFLPFFSDDEKKKKSRSSRCCACCGVQWDGGEWGCPKDVLRKDVLRMSEGCPKKVLRKKREWECENVKALGRHAQEALDGARGRVYPTPNERRLSPLLGVTNVWGRRAGQKTVKMKPTPPVVMPDQLDLGGTWCVWTLTSLRENLSERN